MWSADKVNFERLDAKELWMTALIARSMYDVPSRYIVPDWPTVAEVVTPAPKMKPGRSLALSSHKNPSSIDLLWTCYKMLWASMRIKF
jgi:hypothetical protein